MKQNLYDDSVFFDRYMDYRQNPLCLNNTVEQPALLACLPDLEGTRFMDIGCGTGDLCATARERGAKNVLGLDISRRMCDEARRLVSDRIEIVNLAVEDYQTNASFDVIVSSLALHYVADYLDIIRKIRGWLRDGGTFVFSVNHPNYTADLQSVPDFGSGREMTLTVEHYQEEGIRRHYWFVEGVIKYHRTLQTYLEGLVQARLEIRRLLEPRPRREFRNTIPELRSADRRPVFMVVAAEACG